MTQNFSLVEVRRVYPWLAMLRDHQTTTADTDQLTRLRTAGRPTGLIFTNDRCSLLYMNGCELSTFECRIHHAIGEESMAAPSTYGVELYPSDKVNKTRQDKTRGCPGAITDVYGGLCGISLWCLSLRAREKWRS